MEEGAETVCLPALKIFNTRNTLCSTSSWRHHRYRRTRATRSILSLPRFPLSSPLLSSCLLRRYLISPTAEEMKSRPGRDSRDVCPVIRSALLRASSRECSAAVEYVFRAFESADTSTPPRVPFPLILPARIASVPRAISEKVTSAQVQFCGLQNV